MSTRTRILGLVSVLGSMAVAGGAAFSACSFSATNLYQTGQDAQLLFDAPPDIAIPDAAPCQDSTLKICVAGTVLRQCVATNQLPVDTPCDWDCVGEGAEAHCRKPIPSGGVVTSQDLEPGTDGLEGKTIVTSILLQGYTVTFDTDSGQITTTVIGQQQIRQAGTGVRNGIEFEVRNNGTSDVGVFRFDSLTFEGYGTVRFTGDNAVALVSVKTINVKDAVTLDLRGSCEGGVAGPGGRNGGNGNQPGQGNGAGGAGDNTNVCTGGGGAGFGRNGANGGNRNNPGQGFGTPTISTLVGGSGGGGGGGGGGVGGGGGGALHLVANGAIVFNGNIANIVLNAGGCGGSGGACGGGGGAGGAVLVEGRTVDFQNTYLVANGGGGGGAANGSNGQPGQTTNPANGGAGAQPQGPNNDGGDGGRGGDRNNMAAGGGVRDARGGGGGGGVGWVRINTKSGSIGTNGNVLVSPNLGSSSSSTGAVTVQ